MALSPGLLDSMPGAVAIAQANDSESSTTERRARAATRWVHGRDRQHRPQPGDEVSDQFGFVSEVGVFCDAGVTRAVLTVNADVLGDRRSLAPYYWCPGRAKPRGHISVVGRYAEHRGLGKETARRVALIKASSCRRTPKPKSVATRS